jgi:hypothetical protein
MMRNPLNRLFKKPAKAAVSPTILFLGGLSGSGKSSFSRDYLMGRRGWFHMEIDVPGENGIDKNDLRDAWVAFLVHHNPRPLHQELSRRAGGHTHVVLAFSSMMIFGKSHLKSGRGFFHFAYLYGDPERCLQAFLDRERDRGSELGTPHWEWNKRNLICALNERHNRGLVIEAFAPSRERRNPDDIYVDILRIIGESPGQ